MAYNKRNWKARQGTGLNFFSIDGATPVPIVNQPTTLTEAGDALSAGNLNDWEQRIADGFDSASGELADAVEELESEDTALKSAINANSNRITNLEQKAGDYSIVQYRGTNAVPTGKAKYGLVEKIVGKTRAWNQLVDTDTSSVILISGHKYLTVINGSFSIVTGAGTAISVTGGTDCVYDLTIIFGAGNEPATVADALAQLPALGQYNAYDPGSLVSTTVEGVESMGVNIWDEEWELGGYNTNTGEKVEISTRIRSKTGFGVLPNVEYFFTFGTGSGNVLFYDWNGNYISRIYFSASNSFTTPSNCFIVKIAMGEDYGTTYNHDIQICLNSYSDKTTYHPYKTDTLSLSETVTLRSAGSVADELDVESGVITRKVGSYTFDGTETWGEGGTNTTGIVRMAFMALQGIIKGVDNDAVANITNGAGYSAVTNNQTYMKVKGISVASNGKIYIYDENYNTSGSSTSFASYMAGKTIIYELATPTTESADPIPDNTLYTEGGGTVETIQTQTPVIDNCLDVGYLAV